MLAGTGLLKQAAALAASASIAACSTGGAQVESVPAIVPARSAPSVETWPQLGARVPPGGGVAVLVHSDLGRSWMRPQSKKGGALLYISDQGTNDVYVFSYPKLALVGTITGFKTPYGECVDSKGNVYVTNFLGSQVLEYAHGGTQPIATLSDPGFYPSSCAVNPVNGDLAVANAFSSTSSPGSLAVYRRARGKPTLYMNATPAYEYDVTYDGNQLYLAGLTFSAFIFMFQELRQNTIVTLPLAGMNITNLSALQFADGKMTIGNDNGNYGGSFIYRFAVTGTNVSETTPLDNSSFCVNYTIAKHVVICPDFGVSSGYVTLYNYPAGGSPIETLNGFVHPAGSAISP